MRGGRKIALTCFQVPILSGNMGQPDDLQVDVTSAELLWISHERGIQEGCRGGKSLSSAIGTIAFPERGDPKGKGSVSGRHSA